MLTSELKKKIHTTACIQVMPWKSLELQSVEKKCCPNAGAKPSGKLQCSFFAQHILDLVKCASYTDCTTAPTTQQCGSFYFFQFSKTASFFKKCEAVRQSRSWPLNPTPALRRLRSCRFVALSSFLAESHILAVPWKSLPGNQSGSLYSVQAEN